MKVDRVVVDAKTGETRTEQYEFIPTPPVPTPKGLDLEKLKTVLLAKGIIADKSEVESTG